MRAAILREYGTTPEVGEFDDPVAGEGQAVVEVLAAGLNPVDLRRASGSFYGGSPPLPSVAAWEGVGRTQDGQRVYFSKAVPPYGSFAERTLIEPARSFPVPDGVDDALAVALGVAGQAAWLALQWRAGVQAGDVVLILGASGPVGQVGVQAARLMGASWVVAAARSENGLARAEELGADATVRLEGGAEELAAAFREAAGDDGGFDVVLDPVWGEPAVAAVAACNPFARLAQLGESASAEATLTSAAIRGKPISIVGHTNLATPDDVARAAYTTMCGHAAAGELVVELERVPLEEAPSAWERQAGAPGVKLVIVP